VAVNTLDYQVGAGRRWYNCRMEADFWFDPSCPYTWVTARWLVEVTSVRPVSVCWRVMSLSVLNEGRDDDPEGDPDGYLWVPVRICAAVREEFGHEALGRFYAELWHPDHRGGDWTANHTGALARAGLPTRLADAGMSTDNDSAVRASHAEAIRSSRRPSRTTPASRSSGRSCRGRPPASGPVSCGTRPSCSRAVPASTSSKQPCTRSRIWTDRLDAGVALSRGAPPVEGGFGRIDRWPGAYQGREVDQCRSAWSC
jgi:hypothetical protein